MKMSQEPKVGLRIRSIREQQGLSLRAVAERCGLSINAISQIERGETSPTVSSLHRLASALGNSITDFFQEDVIQKVVVVKRDLGMRSQTDGIVMESLGTGLFNQRLEPFRMIIQPGGNNLDDPVKHDGEEFVHCLEGEIYYYVGERQIYLGQGDSLLFDATEPHCYQNQTDRQAAILIVFQGSQDRQKVQQMHLNYRK